MTRELHPGDVDPKRLRQQCKAKHEIICTIALEAVGFCWLTAGKQENTYQLIMK
ncbi:MAG: hypothetical protein KGZ96_13485 [Clostridia bacterium]|jgi:hypothetical protein|nr:hypothetical protein [Clostridia bacterium]